MGYGSFRGHSRDGTGGNSAARERGAPAMTEGPQIIGRFCHSESMTAYGAIIGLRRITLDPFLPFTLAIADDSCRQKPCCARGCETNVIRQLRASPYPSKKRWGEMFCVSSDRLHLSICIPVRHSRDAVGSTATIPRNVQRRPATSPFL